MWNAQEERMWNAVTVSQRFPTWAAACAARERLGEDDGFERFGIERVDVERLGGEFELLIRTDEFHRDQLEHLLRSSGTIFNPAERRESRRSFGTPLVALGLAALTGIGLYTILRNGRGRSGTTARLNNMRAAPAGREAVATAPMFTLEINGMPIAVTKGNESEARAAFEAAEFKAKLRTIESDGRSLWNGSDSFTIRPASDWEVRALVEYAEKLGMEDEEEGDIVLYLSPIDASDDFDETQDG